MELELVTIGTELLLGFTVDTNGAELGRALSAAGIRVTRRTAVADRPAEMHDAISAALDRARLVIATGGLGPTRDDLTRNVAAELFGAELEFDPEVWAMIGRRFARFGRTPTDSNKVQAMVPRGATVLRNQWGTAPGLWLESNRGLLILLPGVPIEMRRLLEHEVLPRLAARAGGAGQPIRSAQLRTTGIPESVIGERLGPLEPELAPLTLAYLPGIEGVDLRLTAWDLPAAEADRRLAAGLSRLRDELGERAYGTGDDDLAAVLLDQARTASLSLAVAESCTGGLVGGRLTAIPGSSDVFWGGITAYQNAVKTALLGVPEPLIAEHGAVSEPVARAMAEGACRQLGADAAVSVTGIAGPGGGTDAKPVGTVCIATAVCGEVRAATRRFVGDRSEIRARSAQAALFDLLRHLRGGPA